MEVSRSSILKLMAITRVSVDSAGNQGNGSSSNPSISANGRFVVFASLPTNIGFNIQNDIFVRDLLTNTTTRVSVDSTGNQANGSSYNPSISGDGRFVAFDSAASNLVPGGPIGGSNIFVRDLLTNTTTRASVDSADQGKVFVNENPSISANGRFVAFVTYSRDLTNPRGTNDRRDIFVRDLLSNTITPVSVDSAGNQANGIPLSFQPSISADGRFVAFSSGASNLVPGDTNNSGDIFMRDLSTNTTSRVSVDSAGNQGNNSSSSPSISSDGRFVAFTSGASNLVPGDTNNQSDIFVRDLSTNTTTRISVDSAGNQGNNFSYKPSISADGRFVAFRSDASNLVPQDTNNQTDIFVRDLLTNTTTYISVDPVDTLKIESSVPPSISANGRLVAFDSDVSNLVPGDTNNAKDIFVSDTGSTPGGINNPRNVINGTSSDDNLTGTPGNDTINGLEGDDVLTGLRSNDILNGGDDNDILNGGKGFDTLNGGLGDDNLIGGVGSDVFILGAGLGVDTISDFGNAQDTIQLINGLTFGQLSISPGTNGTLIGIVNSGEVLAVLRGVDSNLIRPENFISG
jgi:Tol biopolymer transport system component